MSSRYTLVLVLLLLVLALTAGGCADPRPILRLPAPTPIGRPVEPTPTLVPALASAAAGKATEGGASAPAVAPAQPPDASAGKDIFAQNCAACHGPDGKGAIPGTPDFTAPEFGRNEVPSDLFQVISNGKGAMPAWSGTLDEQQRWDVLFYVLDLGVSDEEVARGKEVYTQNCVACHGPDGKGVVEGTPDFTSPETVAGNSLATFFDAVTNGKGAMPAWGSILSEEDRWAALSYIRTLGYKSTHQP